MPSGENGAPTAARSPLRLRCRVSNCIGGVLRAQQGQEAETHRVYSPYAIEALHALGCDADGTVLGNCDYTCEPDPTPVPAVCGAR